MANPTKIPVYLVTGQTGAGKSTLVARLIRETTAASMRKAVLIRHRHAKGAMLETYRSPTHMPDTDSEKTTRSEYSHEDYYSVAHFSEVFDFGSGCACCAPDGDLMRQLIELKSSLHYSRDPQQQHESGPGGGAGDEPARTKSYVLFVETTGLADPRPFLRVFCHEPAVSRNYQLHGVISVVDTLRWEKTLKEQHVGSASSVVVAETQSESQLVARGLEQLRAADLIVLNTCGENADPRSLSGLRTWLGNRVLPSSSKHVEICVLDVAAAAAEDVSPLIIATGIDLDAAGGGPYVTNLRSYRDLHDGVNGHTQDCTDPDIGICISSPQLFPTTFFGRDPNRSHDNTFQTACLFGDDTTLLDFDRHCALLLQMLSDGELFRVQGWLSFLPSTSTSSADKKRELLPNLLAPTILVDAVGPHPVSFRVSAHLPDLASASARGRDEGTRPESRHGWGLHGGAKESLGEYNYVCGHSKLFVCGRRGAVFDGAQKQLRRRMKAAAKANGEGSPLPYREDYDEELREVFQSGPRDWLFYDLRLLLKELVAEVRKLVVEEAVPATVDELAEAYGVNAVMDGDSFSTDITTTRKRAEEFATCLLQNMRKKIMLRSSSFAVAGSMPAATLHAVELQGTGVTLEYDETVDSVRLVLQGRSEGVTAAEHVVVKKRELIPEEEWMMRGAGLWLAPTVVAS